MVYIYIYTYTYFGGVVCDFRVFRDESDAKTRIVHGRRTGRMQKSGAPEQDRALATVSCHFGD